MTTRQEKLCQLMKEEISDILRREIKDPRLGFFTIIDAEISSDLRHAKIFVSIMGTEEERKQSMEVLKHAQHFVRLEFGKRVRMKVLPDIYFVLDESVDKGVRMLELLEEIRRDEEKRS